MGEEDEGPQWTVPRPVWQFAFAVVLVIGMLPWFFYEMKMRELSDAVNMFREPDNVEMVSHALVFAIYVTAIGEFTRKALRWLFGPIPARRRDRNRA